MDSQTDAEILDEYAYTPLWMVTGMVNIRDEDAPLRPRARSWATTRRDARPFNALPVEVLHIILGPPDFLSLPRSSRTSGRAHELVESLPAYRDLLRHVPKALAALGRMLILDIHGAQLLRATLYSERCVCCENFGASSSPITCQRACFECLAKKQAFWAMPRAEAAKCFDVPPKELKRLPAARGLPDRYLVMYGIKRSRPQRLVSGRAAEQLAMKLHGGTEASLAAGL
ncbi:hypothetical protein IF1G_09977 [Cordyceps javanica]|uniref:F-box domain-containing protein n=1 Tax=Cordyceps javanica TaxID=43265 RepID=A0A545VN60_9HYPO|nr:hypothetical protein IF1G_09977 [Cordyceps javanica]TQW03106.1 hypothetical protein IF2G_09239 [Cordyceps javanica]